MTAVEVIIDMVAVAAGLPVTPAQNLDRYVSVGCYCSGGESCVACPNYTLSLYRAV